MTKERKESLWNAENSMAAMERFVEQNGRFPVAKEMTQSNGLPSRRTFEGKTKISFYEYGRQYHPELVELSEAEHRQHVADSMLERSTWTKETLFTAVKSFVDQHNRLPDVSEYNAENNLPSRTTFCRIAEATLMEYMGECFREFINQNLSQEDITDGMRQEESSPKMTMALY